MQLKAIACGILLLCFASYLDNTRGPLIPALRTALDLSYVRASWFLIAGNIASVLGTLCLIPLVDRFGDRTLTWAICLLAVVSVALGPLVSGTLSLAALGALVGIVAATGGAMSNLWIVRGTTPSDRGRFLCSLHMMYGFGSLLGPVCTGLLLERGFAWYTVLLVAAPAFLALGLWVRASLTTSAPSEAAVSPPYLLRLGHLIAVSSFVAYAVGEVLLSTWLAAYLVEASQMTSAQSAHYVSGFFLLMGLTRAACFFAPVRWEKTLLWACLVCACGFFVAGREGWLLGFPLAGIMGPFFPLMLGRMSRVFPDQARKLILGVLTTMQIALAVFHSGMGRVSDLWGIRTAYWAPLAMLLTGLALFLLFERVVVQKDVAAPDGA